MSIWNPSLYLYDHHSWPSPTISPLQTCSHHCPSLQSIFYIATKDMYLKSAVFKCSKCSNALRIFWTQHVSNHLSFSSPCRSACSNHTKFSTVPGTSRSVSILVVLVRMPFFLISHISTFIQPKCMKLPLCAGTLLGSGGSHSESGRHGLLIGRVLQPMTYSDLHGLK